MTWWESALWGGFGGLSIEALEFVRAMRLNNDWPWRDARNPTPLIYAVSVFVRTFLGIGLAAAAQVTGQVAGPLAAIAIGVSAPLVLEQMSVSHGKDVVLSLEAAAPPTSQLPEKKASKTAAKAGKVR
jgi:hypothetical protein